MACNEPNVAHHYGIFDSRNPELSYAATGGWYDIRPECDADHSDVSGMRYFGKAYESRDLAEEAVRDWRCSHLSYGGWSSLPRSMREPCAYVYGTFDSATGRCGTGAVLMHDGREEFLQDSTDADGVHAWFDELGGGAVDTATFWGVSERCIAVADAYAGYRAVERAEEAGLGRLAIVYANLTSFALVREEDGGLPSDKVAPGFAEYMTSPSRRARILYAWADEDVRDPYLRMAKVLSAMAFRDGEGRTGGWVDKARMDELVLEEKARGVCADEWQTGDVPYDGLRER